MATKYEDRPPDATDRHILRLVQKQADLTHGDIAEQVGIDPCNVSRRIARMERLKYLLVRQALLSPQRFGFGFIGLVFVRMKLHAAGPFIGFREQVLPVHFPNVIECKKLTGPWDYFLKVVCADMKEFNDIVEALARRDDIVERVESHPVMHPTGDEDWRAPILPI